MIETSTAWSILIAITAAGVVLWLWSTMYFLKAIRSTRPSSAEVMGRFEPEEKPRENIASGCVDLSGAPAELSEKLAAVLSRNGLAGYLVRIASRSDRELVFDVLGPAGMPMAGGLGGAPPRGIKRGWVQFEPAGTNQTHAEYFLETPAGAGLIIGGGVFVCLGLAALAGGFFLSQKYVIPDPRFRDQIFQMAQAVHFLWPPFMFGGVLKRLRSALPISLATMIQNLPHMNAY
jgi:hypothetical protein